MAKEESEELNISCPKCKSKRLAITEKASGDFYTWTSDTDGNIIDGEY